MKNMIVLIVLVLIAYAGFLNFVPQMSRAGNKILQKITKNEWVSCTLGYYSLKNGVTFIEGDSFEIASRYEGALLTVNVEVENGTVSIRLVGEGDYPISQNLGRFSNFGSVVYPIQNINHNYTIEIMTDQDTSIELCRISITPYR